MGQGAGEEWDEKKYPDTKQTQPQTHQETVSKEEKQSGCALCCARTRKCLMSGECGRALQISSVIAWCGMCIGMWT